MQRVGRRIGAWFLVLDATTGERLGAYDNELEQWYHLVTGNRCPSLAAAKRLYRGK